MRHPPCVTAFFFTIPSALKAPGSINGQDAAVAVKSVAKTMAASVERAIVRFVRLTCHPIQSHAHPTMRTASHVAQRCAWSKAAIEPPANASSDAGRVNGRMQHAVQAAAASAVKEAAPATFPPAFAGPAQPKPGESFEGRLQDGPITLM
jgi:hypothetical protein